MNSQHLQEKFYAPAAEIVDICEQMTMAVNRKEKCQTTHYNYISTRAVSEQYSPELTG